MKVTIRYGWRNCVTSGCPGGLNARCHTREQEYPTIEIARANARYINERAQRNPKEMWPLFVKDTGVGAALFGLRNGLIVEYPRPGYNRLTETTNL